MILVFNIDLEESRILSIIWEGFIQSMKALIEKTNLSGRRGNFASRPTLDSNSNSSLSLQHAGLSCNFGLTKPHNHQFLKINFSSYIHTYILSVLFLLERTQFFQEHNRIHYSTLWLSQPKFTFLCSRNCLNSA